MEKVFREIEKNRDAIIKTLCDLVEIPAVSPLEGGRGEKAKADYLVNKMKTLGLGEAEVYNSPDPAAAGGVRPNIVLRIKGREKRRLWIIAHMDVVPAGESALWKVTAPFKATVKDGEVYGRGSNDNGEEIAAGLYAAVALKELGLTPEYETCLCYVADEELGSRHGISFLISEGLFSKDDIVYVPDSGSLDGGFIETAEKAAVWMEFTIDGKQVHASIPDRGVNSCRAANELSYLLDRAYHAGFKEHDELFDPPVSTFEPTRRLANVENVNTVPGRDTAAFDCRLLPSAPMETFERITRTVMAEVEKSNGVKITMKYLQKGCAAPATARDSEAVRRLEGAVKKVLSLECRVGGIGGGTCAALLRSAGIPAAVWGQANPSAHQPDESVAVEHLINETKVFASVMMGE
ncbi:M20 family metallo-hydrolase [Cloacibacillus evryensis]|uniref:M20 family metallo-hydrolase n=1 Tax=Cloacibacillus evryensis TaxID=508460 RepID=UPI0025857100|nr:M20 family metallo-hydrolase [Cloacibacillus evryensis]